MSHEWKEEKIHQKHLMNKQRISKCIGSKNPAAKKSILGHSTGKHKLANTVIAVNEITMEEIYKYAASKFILQFAF